MSPRALFTRLAIAEAVTWALLLLGMVLKYGTHTTDLGVRVFGLAHGVVFLGYCLASLVMWVNQRWSTRTLLLALAAAIPPFATIWFEKRAMRQGLLEGDWRFGRDGAGDAPRTVAERMLAAAIARPGVAVAIGVVGVALLTGALLVVGPPPLPGKGS